MSIGLLQDRIDVGLKIGREGDLHNGDVGNVGRYAIHAVGGRQAEDVVDPGFAENPDQQVDGLITAVAQKNLLGPDPLDLGNLVFEQTLERIGIPVETRFEGVFVGVEQYTGHALEFGAGRGVRPQGANVGSDQGIEATHDGFCSFCKRILTANLCASSCSAAAIVSTAGPSCWSPAVLNC